MFGTVDWLDRNPVLRPIVAQLRSFVLALLDDPRSKGVAALHAERFPLLSYFSVSCGVVMALIAISMTIGYWLNQSALLQAAVERQHVAVAQSIANSLWARQQPNVKSDASDQTAEALDRQSVAREIKVSTSGLPVLTLDIYSPQGIPVFVTDDSRAAALRRSESAIRQVARSAIATSTIEHRDRVNGLDDKLYSTTVAETIVPVLNHDAQVRLVFVISADVVSHVANVRRATWLAALLAVVACLVLYVVLFLIVGRADRIIAYQHTSLDGALAAAHKAEAEARAIANELETSNENITNLNVELAQNVLRLKEAQEEIIRKGKMAQLGQLTATVAHEIRNPLGAVRTAAFLVERKLEGKGMAVEKQMERISNGIKRCDLIISELLDFARSKSLSVKSVALDEWVAGIVEEERREMPTRVALEADYRLGGVELQFDPDRMRRVLINLLSNAVEAMVGKGKEAAPNPTAEPRIRVVTEMVGDRAAIRVIDNGPGISEDNLARIMEPLFTTKSFGVGLGLPAVEKILSQHGGGLEIQSKLGEGTTMTAWVPLVLPQSLAA